MDLQLLINDVKRFFGQTFEDYFRYYRLRGLMLSLAAPVIIGVPVFLMVKAFKPLSLLTPLYIFLAMLLLVPWFVIPLLFVLINAHTSESKGWWYWLWGWVAVMVVSSMTWLFIL